MCTRSKGGGEDPDEFYESSQNPMTQGGIPIGRTVGKKTKGGGGKGGGGGGRNGGAFKTEEELVKEKGPPPPAEVAEEWINDMREVNHGRRG